MKPRRTLAVLLVLAGCNAINPQSTPDGATPMDVVPPPDANVPEVFVDSGCPSSAPVTTTMLPATGFLPPVRARFARSVDGDTAHFVIPITGDIDVRFLWVNTEESHGDVTTAFGTRTAAWAAATMPTVREFVLVFQEDSRMRGQPALDPYMRRLALIFADGDLWQRRLVREGWSAYYTDFGCAPAPVHQSLLFAEAEARANRRGIWAMGHPTNYNEVFARWISNRCRPNPFRNQPYCTL
jgi:endonuclease YncB( thermonuclease family)